MSNHSTILETKGIERFKKSRARVWRNRNNRSTLVSRLFAHGQFEAPDAFDPTNKNIDWNIARLRTCLYADALYDEEARRRDVKGTTVKRNPELTKLQKLLKVARAEAVERDLIASAMVVGVGSPFFPANSESRPPSPVYSASPERPYSPTCVVPEPRPVEI